MSFINKLEVRIQNIKTIKYLSYKYRSFSWYLHPQVENDLKMLQRNT